MNGNTQTLTETPDGAVTEPLADTAADTPAGAQTEAEKPAKAAPLSKLVIKRDGQTFVRFGDTVLVPGFNKRDMNAQENKDHVAFLKSHIFGLGDVEEAEGVRNPLRGFYRNGKIELTSGHCRHAAVGDAIAEGVEGASEDFEFPLILEDKEASPADLAESLLLDNSGKPFSPHEQALAMAVLHTGHGYTLERVAAMVNPPMTAAQAKNYILLASATPNMVKWMRDGLVSPTTVHQAIAHYLPRNADDKAKKAAVRNAETALKQSIAAVGSTGRVTGQVFKQVAKQLNLPAVPAPKESGASSGGTGGGSAGGSTAGPGASQSSLDLGGDGTGAASDGAASDGDGTGSPTDATASDGATGDGSSGTGAAGATTADGAAPDGTAPDGTAAAVTPVVRQQKRRSAAEKEMAYELYDAVSDAWNDSHIKVGKKEVVITMDRAVYDKLNALIEGENAAPPQAGQDDEDEDNA